VSDTKTNLKLWLFVEYLVEFSAQIEHFVMFFFGDSFETRTTIIIYFRI